jgi:hypothetical protein
VSPVNAPTDRHYPVLSRGNGSEVDLVLVRVGGQKPSQVRPTLTGKKVVPEMELEGRFHQALEKVNRFAIDGDRLMLYNSDVEVAQFVSE